MIEEESNYTVCNIRKIELKHEIRVERNHVLQYSSTLRTILKKSSCNNYQLNSCFYISKNFSSCE